MLSEDAFSQLLFIETFILNENLSWKRHLFGSTSLSFGSWRIPMVNQCASTLQWLCLHALEDTPDLTLTKKWFPSETVGDDPGYLPGVCGWALRSLLRGRSQVMQMWPSGSTKKFWCRWFMRSLLMYGMSLCICMFTYIYVLFYDIYIFCFIYI